MINFIANKDLEELALSIIKERIFVETKDSNLFISEATKKVSFDAIFQGNTHKKVLIIDLVAENNLSRISDYKLNLQYIKIGKLIEKENSKINDRISIGRLRGGSAGALNRDIDRLGKNKDNLIYKLKTIISEIEKREKESRKTIREIL